MNVGDFARDAARTADAAVRAVLDSHAKSELHDEDDVNSGIVGGLKVAFAAKKVRGFSWSASVLRHRRGIAAEEKRVGADILIHIALNTPDLSYSKGVLIQAKNAGPEDALSQTDLKKLKSQCGKMLARTPAAFVFSYGPGHMRCGAASILFGNSDPAIFHRCHWTSYRFFLELFRCPIGDPRIRSSRPEWLTVPYVLSLRASGDRLDPY